MHSSCTQDDLMQTESKPEVQCAKHWTSWYISLVPAMNLMNPLCWFSQHECACAIWTRQLKNQSWWSKTHNTTGAARATNISQKIEKGPLCLYFQIICCLSLKVSDPSQDYRTPAERVISSILPPPWSHIHVTILAARLTCSVWMQSLTPHMHKFTVQADMLMQISPQCCKYFRFAFAQRWWCLIVINKYNQRDPTADNTILLV